MRYIITGSGLPVTLAVITLPAFADVPQGEASWELATPLPEERTEVSITTDGERVYLLGGFGPNGEPNGFEAEAPRAVWAFDPGDDRWTQITELPEGVNHAGLAYLDGKLYVVGGWHEATMDSIDDVRIYDIADDAWRDGPPLPTARGAHGVAVLDGRIHAIGGVDVDGENTGAHEIYDPDEATWSSAAELPTPRDHIGAVAYNGEIFVLAGRDDTSFTLTNNEIYDSEGDEWRDGAAVPTGRSGVAAVEHEGWLYLFGGETFEPEEKTFDEAERYHPAEDRWEALPPMPTARHGLGAAVVDRRIYVVSGGPEPGLAYSGANEVLVPPE